MHMSKEQILTIIGAVSFFLMGLRYSFFGMQKEIDKTIKFYEESRFKFVRNRSAWVREIMLAPSYIWQFRIFGFISLIVSGALIWLLLSGEVK